MAAPRRNLDVVTTPLVDAAVARPQGDVAGKRVAPGTVRRILGFAKPYKRDIILFLVLVVFDAAIGALDPAAVQDPHRRRRPTRGTDRRVVMAVAFVVVGLALVDAMLNLVMPWYSARIGEGLIYDLRVEGLRACAADADRVLHPYPDRRAGQPAEQRRASARSGPSPATLSSVVVQPHDAGATLVAMSSCPGRSR